jgi:hypothetical protein
MVFFTALFTWNGGERNKGKRWEGAKGKKWIKKKKIG